MPYFYRMRPLDRIRHGLWLACGLALLMAAPVAADDVKVTIKTRAPIQSLDDQGHPTAVSMSLPGSGYILVRTQDDRLILKDAAGKQYLIRIDATDYTPPAPTSTPSVPSQPVVTASTATANVPPITAQTPSPTTTTPVPSTSIATSPAGSLSGTDTAAISQLNDALGFTLLVDDHFWDDKLDDVADRLKWPKESATTTEASYRRYSKSGTTILDAPAYSMALYGKNGKPTYISIVYSNAGDFSEAKSLGLNAAGDAVEKVQTDLAQAVKKDADAIGTKLTAILGQPNITLFGNSSSNRDEVHRWDWKDVSFLLSAHNGAYTTLKIIPANAADHFGSVEVTDRQDLKDLLAQRVVKRDNGDVVISEIPMVDQGPKGYCVPATWERYLRYVDVPADLYVLAMIGGTGYGGGTNTDAMRAGVDDYVSAYHRRIEVINDPLDVLHVSRYIDKGLPLMWTCFITKAGEVEINSHTKTRQTVTDWTTYKLQLAADDKLRETKEPTAQGTDNGHMRMIIGYNATTDELAISDSWGERTAERWISVKEANDISGGDLEYIQW